LAFARLVHFVGFHLEQAWRYRTELGAASDALTQEAGERLWAAARSASRRMKISSAVGLYERALTILPEEPTGDLLRELAATLARAQDGARAWIIAERAIQRARSAGNRRGELRARLDCLWQMPPDPPGIREAAPIRHDAEELIPELVELEDDAGLTSAWQLVAMSETSSGQHEMAAAALQKALRYARRLGDPMEESEVRVLLLGSTFAGSVHVDEAIARCEQELRNAQAEWGIEASALAFTAVLHAMRGDFDLARRRIARATELTEEFNLWIVSPAHVHAMVEMLAEDFAAAEEILRAAEGEIDANAYREWWGMGFLTRALIAATLCAQGRFEEAASLTEEMPSARRLGPSTHRLAKREGTSPRAAGPAGRGDRARRRGSRVQRAHRRSQSSRGRPPGPSGRPQPVRP
jgi:tetratricopeptide (TPR) repeat protein